MNLHLRTKARWPVRLACLGVFGLFAPLPVEAFNSEEHKFITDRGVALVTVDPSIVFPAHTGYANFTPGQRLSNYLNAKSLAVGFYTNNPNDYSEDRKGVQDNSYWYGYGQRAYNLVMHMPSESDLLTPTLLIRTHVHGNAQELSLGELVALYGDYRRTTYCEAGSCYLTNSNTTTLVFNYGNDCFGPFDCGWRPAPVDMMQYLRCIGSGLVPPFGGWGNTVQNTAYDHEWFDAGWWGDEMLRIANVNDWHFSSAAAAWYTGMHRLAALYVDSARINPIYWNHALHYEANALHSLTDLFCFGHVITNRDETSWGIMDDEGLLNASPYQWQEHVLEMGGGDRVGAGRVSLSASLPPVTDRTHPRNEFMASYRGNWWTWANAERNYHDDFNRHGANVFNLRGQRFNVFGDGYLKNRTHEDREIIAQAVRASVQSLFDAYVALESGAPLSEITSEGSDLFEGLRYIPVFVEADHSYGLRGRWTRYAGYLDAVTGAGVVPGDWTNCILPYVYGGGWEGSSGDPGGDCDIFPASAAVDDGGGVVPGDFVLRQNYPNPFNPSTVIEYALPEPVQVRLEVFNLLGRRVRTLADGFRPPGQYRVVWDGTNEAGYSVASGTYFYRITSGDRIETRKLLLIR